MPEVSPNVPGAEPEIHTIPEKFYGAALKAKLPEPGAPKTATPTSESGLVKPAQNRTGILIVAGVAALILIVGGGATYYFKDLLFPPPEAPAPKVIETPAPSAPVAQAPSAPTDLSATSTSPSNALVAWVDTASNESGFRLERAEDTGSFQSLTNLPPNSTSFLDNSVVPGKTYRYRVIASNQGGESQPSQEALAVVPTPPPTPPESPKLPPAGLDTDSDGLSDLEEALFTTDVRNPDTDGDGFLDGNELFHLYNPAGRAPGTLVGAGLVKPHSGTVGWTMMIPAAWTITMDTADGTKATVDSGRAEKFRLSVEENPKNQSVVDWYLASHPDVKLDQVLQYRSKKGYQGIIGADLLTTYIPWGSRIFVFTYDLNGQPFINYRTTYSMMLNSLILNGLPQITTSTVGTEPLPFEPAATTTGVIAQPESIFPSPQEATSSPSTP